MISFNKILTTKEGLEKGLEIARERNEKSLTRYKESPYYLNEYALLNKLIITWLEENAVIKYLPNLYFGDEFHDYLLEKNDGINLKTPDFNIKGSYLTVDLKVPYYGLEGLNKALKEKHGHNADILLVWDQGQYMRNKYYGCNGWYILYKSDNYKMISSKQTVWNDKKFNKLAEEFERIENQKYI